MSFKIKEIQAKSILKGIRNLNADFVINPYIGCQFSCMYCFASYTGKFLGETNENWGNYVYVNTNAVELVEKEIKYLLNKKYLPRIVISTITDPYQKAEKKYRLTRQILKVITKYNYQGCVEILSKSPTLLEDINLLKKIPNLEVGVSITTEDDKLSHFLEAQAPLLSTRLRILKKLNASGIKTFVIVGPFLPHMIFKPKLIDELFTHIKFTGTHDIKIAYLSLPKHIKPKIDEVLQDETLEIKNIYKTTEIKKYRDKLEPILRKYLLKHNLKLKFGEFVH